MQITVVAVMCHVLGAIVAEGVGTLPDAVCREVIVIKQDMPMQAGHANAGLHAFPVSARRLEGQLDLQER
jgi:hypothetical protein